MNSPVPTPGIKDTLILFTMGVLMMTTQFFGHLLPVQVTTKGWVTWGLGCVPYMVSWAPLIVYYAQLAEVCVRVCVCVCMCVCVDS
jgi:hypothetical protein